MADYSDLAAATQAVADPCTSAADLAQIASWHAKLQRQVAAHPNADPDMLSWLGVNTGDLAKQVAAERQTQVAIAPASLPAPRHAAKPFHWLGRRHSIAGQNSVVG